MSSHPLTDWATLSLPFSCYDICLHGTCITVAITAIAVGILAVLASRGILTGPWGSFAAIGTPGGYILIGCGICGAGAEILALATRRKIPLQVPMKDTHMQQAVQREICCGLRFMHGEQDERNPVWDTLEGLNLMTWGMGAFHRIPPYEDQLDKLQTDFQGMPEGQVSILFCGHASFLIKTPAITLLTDPNWEESIPFCGPIRGYYRSIMPPCTLEDLPKVDHILLSHTHPDHFSVPTLTYLNQLSAQICCPQNAQSLLEELTQVQPLTWWQKVTLAGEVEVTFLPTDHASQTTACNCNAFLWGGYKISIPLAEGQTYTIWFTGDSACNINPGITNFEPTNARFDITIFSQIADQFSEGIDLVLFQTDPPVGQEDKHWNVWQGLDMLTRLFAPHFKSNAQIIPMHWGTWSFDGFGRDLLAPLTILQSTYQGLSPEMYARLHPMKVGETQILVS